MLLQIAALVRQRIMQEQRAHLSRGYQEENVLERIKGTQFTCFTGTTVQILTHLQT
jgi:hypothetical protein